jgi:hypothetical protein
MGIKGTPNVQLLNWRSAGDLGQVSIADVRYSFRIVSLLRFTNGCPPLMKRIEDVWHLFLL